MKRLFIQFPNIRCKNFLTENLTKNTHTHTHTHIYIKASIYYPDSSKDHCRDTEDHMENCQYKDENV